MISDTDPARLLAVPPNVPRLGMASPTPQSNVVIELNGLKIAEDRTFADCARYMLTALLSLALPPPPQTPIDYLPLFKAGKDRDRGRVAREPPALSGVISI